MRHFLTRFLVVIAACSCGFSAAAQDDDKGFLTRKLQDLLSDAGRDVQIDGFEGALSSEARFDRMTIADDQGIWLTLEDVVLDWNRSALLRGRLEVERLSAAVLDVPRLPDAGDEATVPDAEASGFALPDLPVAIDVKAFEVSRINLGPPILGEAASLKVTATAALNDAGAQADILADRLDAQQGSFAVKADFTRDTNVLDLFLDLSEDQEGIAARLLNLPGLPSVKLSIDGNGPLSDFAADIKLATDGQDRIAGQVTLVAQTPERATATPDLRVKADIGGDITALIATEYHDFFGPDVQIELDAVRTSDGSVKVDDFSMQARSADLRGQVRINAEGWPTFIDVAGQIADVGGAPVVLPGTAGAASVDRVDLRVAYDAEDGEALDAGFDITSLAHPLVRIGATKLALNGTLQGNLGSVGQLLADLEFQASDVELRDENAAEALGQAVSGKANINFIEGQPIRISDLALQGADYGLSGQIIVGALADGFVTRLNVALNADRLARFAALTGQPLLGAADLAISGNVVPLAGTFNLDISGSTRDLKVGVAQADAVLTGQTQLALNARRSEQGTFVRDLSLTNAALDLRADAQLRSDDSIVSAQAQLRDIALVVPQYNGPVSVDLTATQDPQGWRVDGSLDAPHDTELVLKGLATGPDADLAFDLSMPDVNPFVPQVSGRLDARGRVSQSGEGWRVDVAANGPYKAQVALQGLVSGPGADLTFDLKIPEVKPLVPQVSGRLETRGRVRQSPDGWRVDVDADGPYRAQVAVQGLATGPEADLTYTAALPDISALVPQLNGPLKSEGRVRQSEKGWLVDVSASGPLGADVALDGLATGPDAALNFSGRLPDVAALVPRISGPLSVRGTAQRQAKGWQLDSSADGPSGTNATISGLRRNDGTLDMALNGSAPLGLSRPFLAPRVLQGTAQFDLNVNGPPALSSLSGRVTTSGASLNAPNLRLALSGIAADVVLNAETARIEVSAAVASGGRMTVRGVTGLTGGLNADLAVNLDNVVYIDPRLFRTTLNGAITLNGQLTGGARIAGQINVGETDVTVPSTGLTGIGGIPPITHIGASGAIQQTRRRADVVARPGTGSQRAGPVYPLAIQVNAPNRIFVRGRGVDAELGGALTLSGNTGAVISVGRFELIRGRIDILGKRFNLVEGSAQFQGDLVPYIRFVTETETDTSTVRIILDGPADHPSVTFNSTPDAPQDEVLSQLLFGRDLSQISAFQALQLASAVATLAGSGGAGIIGNLREGFGLDDLDITTTDEGATAVRAGKYLSENVYTDVTAASDGTGEVSLNLDISKSLKAKGTVGSDGNTGIGIFFEKDY